MTKGAFTIGLSQPLSVAHEVMREHRVRHLPVLARGAVVGVVSQRDLYFIETLKGVDPSQVAVAEAMSPEPLLVAPDAPLDEVVAAMADRKLGCAVVMAGERIAGMFTTTDALHALASVLHEEKKAAAPPRRAPATPPSQPRPRPRARS